MDRAPFRQSKAANYSHEQDEESHIAASSYSHILTLELSIVEIVQHPQLCS